MQMKNLLKEKLLPLRRLVGRVAVYDYQRVQRDFMPINLAANFVCSENVPGDFLEFGVFKGASFITAYHEITSAVKDWSSEERAYRAYSDTSRVEQAFAKVTPNKIRFFAFDSFDGLPEPQGLDANSFRYSKGRYDCTEEEFKRRIARGGVDLSQVITVPGFYEDSLTDDLKTRLNLTAASIVSIDCDLYGSSKTALDFLSSLVVDGTVIIFSAWFNFKGSPDLGEQQACKEWLEENPEISLTPYARYGLSQQAFIAHKR